MNVYNYKQTIIKPQKKYYHHYSYHHYYPNNGQDLFMLV